MIRFIDLSEDYWTDPEFGSPCCAFLDTVNDCFLSNDLNNHIFFDQTEVDQHSCADRFKALMPEGFFDAK